MRPALVACFIILFITFFKEYTTAIFLFAPGSEVIGTTLLQAWTQGEVGLVSALATHPDAGDRRLRHGRARYIRGEALWLSC